jgi:glycosyltransferase involved in cell wall biosynthesis
MGLLNALREDGHEMIIVAPKDTYTEQIVKAGYDFFPVTMDSRGANPIKDIGLLAELWQLYGRLKPDLVLHYTIKPNIYGTFAASMRRIPVINNVCGLGTAFMRKNMISRIANLLYKTSFRYPHKVFFQNDADLEHFIRNKLVKKDITDLVPGSGIDIGSFPKVPFQRSQPFTFLMISRLITDKGILEYFNAARQLRNKGLKARFQLLGSLDPEHKRGIHPTLLKSWVENHTIEYLGTAEDVRPYIAKADCVVLPSYREGTPRSLLEAASSGKPIVATNVPGCRHVVEHDYNGLLCKLKSADDLAAKMQQMANADDATLMTYGDNGRRKVTREFDEQIVISSYRDAINGMK